MMYNNYPYVIFNPAYLNRFQTLQMEEQRKIEQEKNICDMVKAISDLCEASRKVDPDHEQMAVNACIVEIIKQMTIDNGGNR